MERLEIIKKLEEKILTQDFIPKNDVQQEEFLQKYPIYDGRGIKIAIIDSGVDVSLDGLQKTSTGLPKIIDCFDFTGAGDVDTSTIRKTGEDNILTLLSGRKIKIPQQWKNSSNEWHLGQKSIAEMSPKIVTKKECHKTETIKQNKFVSKNVEIENNIIDCIVWKDDQKWQACIISSEIEKLEDAKVLTNFRDSFEHCFILENTSFAVTIHHNGNLLEIFVPYACHGSCVAQVAAANFPGQPKKDGLAPGAQIISMNANNRDAFEAANENMIQKSLLKCIEMGVDIVNISIPSNEFEKSEIIKLIKKMVNEHGIIIIQSAGNDGPYISSIRNDTINNSDEMFTIGSLFTNGMKRIVIDDYNDEKENADNPPKLLWYYSSRGPLLHGARGITFIAPADAIVQNPKWHETKKDIFVGTSCAAPNAAGAIACLLSGLKANSIPYTPAAVKMALSNTAFLPDGGDRLGFGNGIIQISSAFEYFKNFKETLPKIIVPQISIKKSNEKGIILYKLKNLSYINKYSIKVECPEMKVPWILKLSPEKHNHIEFSKIVENNLFNVKINASNLSPGNIYYSEIHGFHPSNISIGPIFHLPITVIIPEKLVNYSIHKKIFIQPLSIFHHFINPPINSLECTVKLIDTKNGKIEFEKKITKNDDKLKNRHFFTPNESKRSWQIDIQWNKILEIFIYQHIFVDTSFRLKANLEISFDQWKYSGKQWIQIKATT